MLPPDIHILVDNPSNRLIILTPKADVPLLEKILSQTDHAPEEIQIQAQIVAVNQEGLKALGVLWKSQGSLPISQNTQQSLNLSSFQTRTGVDDASGQLGLSWVRLPEGFRLDAVLQALQSTGSGKIISTPEVTVYNQEEGYIEQGKEVPFQTITTEGATQVQFKKAVLGLWVTPQVLLNGNLLLTVKVNNDGVSQTLGHAGSIPIIDTTQMKTHIALHTNETIVLGGISTELTQHVTHQVPLLGDLPGLGHLFRSQQDKTQHAELLIFITPRILGSSAQ